MLLKAFTALATLGLSLVVALPTTRGKHGAVVSQVAECSDIGVEILKKGGNAADAIIASTLCVGTIAAFNSGIGGGGFMLVRFRNRKGYDYEMIDFRETAPAAAHENMFVDSTDPTASTFGGLSVAVPGEIRGWEQLHRRHGQLPWKTLFKPAIDKAKNGFKVNAELARRLSISPSFVTKDPLWAEVYAPHGTVLKTGDTCYRKRYAKTLEILAEHGPDAFYHGKIAQNSVAAAVARGGILTTNDLAGYETIIRQPSNITYRNHRIYSTVAPSSGSAVLSALKIFEGFPGNASDSDPAINVTTHRLIQATRFAYGQRTNFGDPAFTGNVSTLEAEFLLESTAVEARSKINDTQNYDASFYNINNYIVLDDHGTSHLAAVDATGNAISVTTSVNGIWGSGVMTPDGFILNNQMDDFSSPGRTNAFGYATSPANLIRPFKRPQSSIASSIVEDSAGEFVMATGSAGGSRIITATLQNLYHYLDQGLSPEASVHHGRWHDQLTNVTLFEQADPDLGVPGISNATVAYLASINYNVSYQPAAGSVGHIIGKGPGGVFVPGSDPRARGSGGAVW